MIAISQRSLARRISRALFCEDGSRLCRTRSGSRFAPDLGDWYTVNAQNFVTCTNVALEDLGRELNVLRPKELLEASER